MGINYRVIYFREKPRDLYLSCFRQCHISVCSKGFWTFNIVRNLVCSGKVKMLSCFNSMTLEQGNIPNAFITDCICSPAAPACMEFSRWLRYYYNCDLQEQSNLLTSDAKMTSKSLHSCWCVYQDTVVSGANPHTQRWPATTDTGISVKHKPG